VKCFHIIRIQKQKIILLDFAKDLLKEIGDKSKKLNQRLTFHPGPFNCLGSPHLRCNRTYYM
jgi:UV DNA damage repair endonuclease